MGLAVGGIHLSQTVDTRDIRACKIRKNNTL